MLKKILLSILSIAALLVVGALGFVWYIGAWNLLFPTSAHDTVAPELPSDIRGPAVLVFTKTNGFRHKDGIAGGLKAFERIAERKALALFATENGAVFNESDLSRFDAIVFLSATGDMLSAEQEAAFQSWLEQGGGWLGVHAAGDGSHATWSWYIEHLIGAEFTAHILGPQFQTATVVSEDGDHPINAGLPATWQAEEEWYSWVSSPRDKGFHVISTVDESSYSPVQNLFGTETDLSMGDHPVAWANCVGSGRTFYTALGHAAAAFEQPEFVGQLENALGWLLSEGACPD